MLPDSFILACAPENSAADLLVERLLPHIDKRNLFRMYATSRPWKFVPEKLKVSFHLEMFLKYLADVNIIWVKNNLRRHIRNLI